MVTSQNFERTIPYVVFNHNIGELTFQIVAMSASTPDQCLEALEEFKKHILNMNKKSEEIHPEEPKTEAIDGNQQ